MKAISLLILSKYFQYNGSDIEAKSMYCETVIYLTVLQNEGQNAQMCTQNCQNRVNKEGR